MKKMDVEFSLEAVPLHKRNGFFKTLVVMLGLTFFSASMMSGGELGQGLTFVQFIGIVLVGNLILGGYTGALAYIAAKTGLSTHLLARYAFGEKGSFLPSFLLAFTQIGWFGVGTAMFAVPVQKVTGIDIYLLIAIAGMAMTFTAFFGMKALAIISFIAVPLITILGSTSVFKAADSIGGMQGLLNYQPEEAISLAAALTICIGSFISAGTLTPDFTRFARKKRSAVVTTVIAFFIGNTLMFVFGAIGSIATGYADISEVMFMQQLILPAIVVLGLNIWTTNDNALYASGLGLSNITKLPKQKLVIFNGIIGTLAAMWLYNNFVGFLTLLGSALPPIGAIILADFFILHRGNYQAFRSMTFQAINWVAIVAWGAGIAAAIFIPGIAPLNALIGSAVVHVVGMRLVQLKEKQVMTSNVEKVSN
ncbi:MAG: cytosine permease [Bacillota bacterium]|uniref:Cytosine permease n=1 Tax=Virgibacillus salarius TaxID=447199 RepID=A0A941I9N1_9BACI|nr:MULTISPECIES: cytosine permease [Bacillaceae]MBR7795723.1 cytosine permease [Virgibacillus salarius]MDY7043227.1 cytosine permease [Virgibacillus sp. M23]NAZ08436.1 cytosine permease [Agaribacter marinus]